jgi:signal transduction histidine kinase
MQKENLELFSFPLCIVGDDQSDFLIKKANNAFSQFIDQKKGDPIGKSILEKGLINIFKGHNNLITQCLRNAEEKRSPANLLLDNRSNSAINNLQQGTWLLEVNPIVQQGSVNLVLSFHALRQSFLLDLKNSSNQQSQESYEDERGILNNEVQRTNVKYQAVTDELNNFAYSVSHDLRAPLRRIDGFSQELFNSYSEQLDETGVHYLKRIRKGAQDMGTLIDDLLKLSRISRQEIQNEHIDIGEVARQEFEKLMDIEPERDARLKIIECDMTAHADLGLIRIMLMNLISNALKFSSRQDHTLIEIGCKELNGKSYFYIKDNGVGFDPAHSDKLFRAFNRLHSEREFAGTGIGLATVKRIVNLTGGEIFAQSEPGEGATFYFNFN